MCLDKTLRPKEGGIAVIEGKLGNVGSVRDDGPPIGTFVFRSSSLRHRSFLRPTLRIPAGVSCTSHLQTPYYLFSYFIPLFWGSEVFGQKVVKRRTGNRSLSETGIGDPRLYDDFPVVSSRV